MIEDHDGLAYLRRKFTSFGTIIPNTERVLAEQAQTAAFEPPGDPQRIIHLASRLTTISREMLDWAADLRATGMGSEALRRAVDAQARLADLPIQQIRTLVEQYLHELDSLPERLLGGEDVNVSLSLKIDLDENAQQEFNRALQAFGAAQLENS